MREKVIIVLLFANASDYSNKTACIVYEGDVTVRPVRIYVYCSVYFTFVVVVSVSFVIVMASLSGLSHEERAARLQQRTREAETALKQLRICIEVIKQQSREQNNCMEQWHDDNISARVCITCF